MKEEGEHTSRGVQLEQASLAGLCWVSVSCPGEDPGGARLPLLGKVKSLTLKSAKWKAAGGCAGNHKRGREGD